jgi:alpha-tubulin suppressor-like RCC1 family protein
MSKQSLPAKIVWQKQVIMIACGENHTLAIANPNAEVFAWGRNGVLN